MNAAPLGQPSSQPAPATHQHPVSVLICDDRTDIRRALVDRVRPPVFLLSPPGDTVGVTDGFALLQALEANPDAAVLIAIHADSTTGDEAITMLKGRHPTAMPIIVGSPADMHLLAKAYTRGAGGLLIWEPEDTRPGAAGTP